MLVKQVDDGVTPYQDPHHEAGSSQGVWVVDDVDCSAAYIEFADPESVKSALMFSGNTFHDRTLVVEPKRKNLPRFMLHRGRGRGRGGLHRGAYRSF